MQTKEVPTVGFIPKVLGSGPTQASQAFLPSGFEGGWEL